MCICRLVVPLQRKFIAHLCQPCRDFTLIVMDRYTGTNLIDDNPIMNATIFTETKFRDMVEDHHFLAMYCLFLPPKFKWKETITSTFQLEAHLSWRIQLINHPAEEFLKGWELDVAKLKRRHFQKAGSSLNRAKVYCKEAEETKSPGMVCFALPSPLANRKVRLTKCAFTLSCLWQSCWGKLRRW